MRSENSARPAGFEGFPPPESNYFRLPNDWIDVTAKIESLAELKVVGYVACHTFRCLKRPDEPVCISVDELLNGRKPQDGSRTDKGTGLSISSVHQGIRLAVDHGYLEEGDTIGRCIRLRMHEEREDGR